MGGSMVPLNLCCLASYTRKIFPEFNYKIIDAELHGLSHEITTSEAIAFSPDLIGITTNTGVFDSVITLTLLLKEKLPDVPIILGGPHVSALPERSLQESSADFVAMGEGELTFEELVGQLHSGRAEFSRILGLAFRDEGGNIIINKARPLIRDLDSLPFPARDLVDNNLYVPPPTKRVSLGPNTLIATSRGCPHNCGFCGAKVVWGRRTRVRSPESVVEEIEECIATYGIRSFSFTDEYFTSNKKRVLAICKLISDKQLSISWVCSSRAERLDAETLKVMKAAGCHEISFGIESGSPEILKKIDKALDLEEAERVIKLTKKAGITTHASYILGYIGETEETIKATIRFAKKMNTHVAAFFIASPLPGTQLYRDAQEKGYLRSDAIWFDYSPLSNSDSVLEIPELPIKTLRKWHRKALRSYYFRPGFILTRIMSIRHFYEIVNLFGGLKIFFRIKK